MRNIFLPNLIIVFVVGIVLSSIAVSVPAGAQESTENQLADADIQAVADSRRVTFEEVKVVSVVAASIADQLNDGNCTSAAFLADGSEGFARQIPRLMTIYAGSKIEHFAGDRYPGCLTPLQLTSAIVDGAVKVSGGESGGPYSVDSYSLDNISEFALMEAVFTYIQLRDNEGEYKKSVNPVELDEALDVITGTDKVFVEGYYGETMEIFGNWVNPDDPEDIQFNRSAVLAMYTVGYFVRSTSDGQNKMPFSVESHKTLYSSWWSSVWANVSYIGQGNLNIFIGFLEEIWEDPVRVSAIFGGTGEDDPEGLEEGLAQLLTEILGKKLVHLPVMQNMLNSLADAIVFNPGISPTGRKYADKRRALATDEAQPLSLLFLLRASTKNETDAIEYVEAAAANEHLLENVTIGTEFAATATDLLKEVMENAWEAGESPDLNGTAGATVNATVNTSTSGFLDNDPLAQFLTKRDGADRFDYSVEAVINNVEWLNSLGGELGLSSNFMDAWQFRIFVTHPRKIGDRYQSELRFRLFDEVGATGTAKVPGVKFSASIGFQNYHDAIIQFDMNADMRDPGFVGFRWRNNYNFMVEGDATFSKEFLEGAGELFHRATGWGSSTSPVAPVASASTTSSKILSGIKKALSQGDIEEGVGYGVAFDYDILAIRDKVPWVLAVGPLLWAGGASIMGVLTFEYVAPIAASFLGPQAAFTATHIGTDFGAALGNLASLSLLAAATDDSSLYKVTHGGFFWGALRPLKIDIVPNALFMRARFQINIDFYSSTIAGGDS